MVFECLDEEYLKPRIRKKKRNDIIELIHSLNGTIPKGYVVKDDLQNILINLIKSKVEEFNRLPPCNKIKESIYSNLIECIEKINETKKRKYQDINNIDLISEYQTQPKLAYHCNYSDINEYNDIIIENLKFSEDPFYSVIDKRPLLLSVVKPCSLIFEVPPNNKHLIVIRCFTEDQIRSKEPYHSWPIAMYTELNNEFCYIVQNSKKDPKIKIKDSFADITNICKEGKNMLKINCTPKVQHYIVIQLMEKVNIETIVNNLKNSRMEVEEGLQFIKNQFINYDEDIIEIKKKISLIDPLLYSRIKLPVRAKMCDHIDCFDIYSFLKMNERIRTWTCPICSSYIPFNTIYIDMYISNILNQIEPNITEVEIKPDGSWCPVNKVNVSNENEEYDDVYK